MYDNGNVIEKLRAVNKYKNKDTIIDYNKLNTMLINNNKYNLSNKEVDTIAFFSDSKHTFVASSIIKEIAQFGGDYYKYVPSVVAKALDGKYKK